MYFPLNMVIFHCNVSLPKGTQKSTRNWPDCFVRWTKQESFVEDKFKTWKCNGGGLIPKDSGSLKLRFRFHGTYMLRSDWTSQSFENRTRCLGYPHPSYVWVDDFFFYPVWWDMLVSWKVTIWKRKFDVQLVISSESCIILFGIILLFSVLLRCVDVEFLWDILAHLAHPKNGY